MNLTLNKKVSSAISSMTNLNTNLANVATNAATEINFYLFGINAGSKARLKLAQEVRYAAGNKEVDANSRVENGDFDIARFDAFDRAFTEVGYDDIKKEESTARALERMDRFATQLERKELEEQQLTSLYEVCLAVSKYTVGL